MNPTSSTAAQLHTDHQRLLLGIAAGAIDDALATGRVQLPDPLTLPVELQEPGATFVTLERDDDLLGCIGTLEPARALALDVAHNAVAAAFTDPRVPPVTRADYAVMSIKVSVLSARERLAVTSYADLLDAVRPGVDGLLLEAGRHRSTLLPSVWPKVGTAAEFLDVLWRKARLRPGAWPAGTRVSRYTTDEFCDPGPR